MTDNSELYQDFKTPQRALKRKKPHTASPKDIPPPHPPFRGWEREYIDECMNGWKKRMTFDIE